MQVPAQYKGYWYLHSAVSVDVDQKSFLYDGIYEEILSKFSSVPGISYYTIERTMRYTINKLWSNDERDNEMLINIFGSMYTEKTHKRPSNMKFATMVADYIRFTYK